MMKILYNPQRSDEILEYEFEKEKVIATFKGITDVFDFTILKKGDEVIGALTSLEVNPVVRAFRDKDNIVYVELRNFVGENASHEERFPEWSDV